METSSEADEQRPDIHRCIRVQQQHPFFKVEIMEPGDFTVADVRRALQDTFGIPQQDFVVTSRGFVRPSSQKLSGLMENGEAWIVAIHRSTGRVPSASPSQQATPPASPFAGELPAMEVHGGASKPSGSTEAAPVKGQGAAPASSTEGNALSIEFIYKNEIKVLPVHLDTKVGDFVAQVLQVEFRAQGSIGILLEGRLLPKDITFIAVLPALQAAPFVPVVNDLVSACLRDEPMPADAFRTDCMHCQTLNVDCKPYPYCSVCKASVVVDVKPPIHKIRTDKTQFTWRWLESLTGLCMNDSCPQFEKYVDVYFNCMCSHSDSDGHKCPSNAKNMPLASYTGGSVETLLQQLYNNQYFVGNHSPQSQND